MEIKIQSNTLRQQLESGAVSEPMPHMNGSRYESSEVLALKIEHYGLQFLMEKDVVVKVNRQPTGMELILCEPAEQVPAIRTSEAPDMVMKKVKTYGLERMVEEGMLETTVSLKETPVIPLVSIAGKTLIYS